MLILRPDFDRRIDLPGTGPCSRPVDIDRSQTGFARLVSLRVYSFAQGLVIDGEAEGDEVFIVLMRGQAGIAVSVDGGEVGAFSLDRNGGSRAVYLPPHAAYRLTATADCDIAYARVDPLAADLPAPRDFAPAGNRLDIIGHATGMDLVLATLGAGEQLAAAEDADARERLIHLRAAGEMTASIAGEPLSDWDSVALDEGQNSLLEVATGAADILTISASTSRNTASKGVTDRQ